MSLEWLDWREGRLRGRVIEVQRFLNNLRVRHRTFVKSNQIKSINDLKGTNKA